MQKLWLSLSVMVVVAFLVKVGLGWTVKAQSGDSTAVPFTIELQTEKYSGGVFQEVTARQTIARRGDGVMSEKLSVPAKGGPVERRLIRYPTGEVMGVLDSALTHFSGWKNRAQADSIRMLKAAAASNCDFQEHNVTFVNQTVANGISVAVWSFQTSPTSKTVYSRAPSLDCYPIHAEVFRKQEGDRWELYLVDRATSIRQGEPDAQMFRVDPLSRAVAKPSDMIRELIKQRNPGLTDAELDKELEKPCENCGGKSPKTVLQEMDVRAK